MEGHKDCVIYLSKVMELCKWSVAAEVRAQVCAIQHVGCCEGVAVTVNIQRLKATGSLGHRPQPVVLREYRAGRPRDTGRRQNSGHHLQPPTHPDTLIDLPVDPISLFHFH